jgi:hypothetical protein
MVTYRADEGSFHFNGMVAFNCDNASGIGSLTRMPASNHGNVACSTSFLLRPSGRRGEISPSVLLYPPLDVFHVQWCGAYGAAA